MTRGCSGSHALEKQRKMTSWSHPSDQDAQSGVMRIRRTSVCKLPFLQLNISCFLSDESWMSQPGVLFALALSYRLGKCQSFLETQKLLIGLELWMSSKTFLNSLRTKCPTSLSVLRWTIRFDKWLWRLKCWNMNVISDSVRLITINNSYLARAVHCPDKSSLGKQSAWGVANKMLPTWRSWLLRICWLRSEHTHHPMSGHSLLSYSDRSDRITVTWMTQAMNMDIEQRMWFNPEETTLCNFIKLDTVNTQISFIASKLDRVC